MKKIVLMVVIGLLVGGVVIARKSRQAVAPKADNMIDKTNQAKRQINDLESTSTSLIIGQPNAKLTVIEYGDFQCPICKRFFDQTEAQLSKDYIDTGKIKLEFRPETHIGVGSVLAAEASYCANSQGKFKAYHDRLYSSQGQIEFTADNLKQFAKKEGIASAEFDNCLDGHKYRLTVENSNREAQTRISGTPTFFIGSQKISGAQPYSVFKSILDSQLP